MAGRYSIIILIFFLAFTELFSQNADLNKYDQEGKKTGVWESYYETGKVKSHGTFKQGHPVGELLKYYPDGILQARMNFDESGRISYVIMFYETGNAAAQGKYIDQQKDSIWNYFSAYDKRKAVSETFSTGKRNGGSYKYYPDGKPSEYLEWKDDNKHGKWEQYYENGQVRLTGTFVTGLLNGNFISYNGDGSLSITGNYISGVMDGIWIYYTETGETDISVEYKDGKMLPNAEMERRDKEFARKIKDAIGNLDDSELNEFQ